jgi:cytoskeletal protein CcmA (bactofilin family)
MTNKKEPVKSSAPGELNALLGKGSEFEGKLVFEGTVRVDGRFKGEIISEGTLMLGDNAQFEGEIRVKRAIVSGELTGDIHAENRLELHAPARVKGNITTANLVVQEGVRFDGNCQMTSAGNLKKEPGAVERPAHLPGRESILRADSDDDISEQTDEISGQRLPGQKEEE